jgi:hypothetical protein
MAMLNFFIKAWEDIGNEFFIAERLAGGRHLFGIALHLRVRLAADISSA